jgi:hypothetical protein
MAQKSEFHIKWMIFAFCLSTNILSGQILKDSISLKLIEKGVDNIYNFKFDNAHAVYNEINKSFPGNPIGFLFRGLITYWENYPLNPSSPAHVNYESDMRKCIELCDSENDRANEPEYLLADLCARGMLLMYYADNNLNMSVIPLATSTYHYIRRSFGFTSVYTDFFFFTGLYNYYREVYPEAFPVYKTLAFLFPKGDRKKGLADLQKAASSSILLKGESASFLSGICLSFENNYQESYLYSKSLKELYPCNIQYRTVYVKNLLLIKNYDEAENLILSSDTNISSPFFKAQLAILNGILQEKKYHNIQVAEQYYNNGIKEISPLGPVGNEFAAYAYFGLSRIADMNKDYSRKKLFRKKAIEIAYFKKVDFD